QYQQGSEDMDGKARQLAQWPDIVHKTDRGHHQDSKRERPGGIAPNKCQKNGYGKYNAPSPDNKRLVGGTRIRFVNDIVTVGYFKIQQQAGNQLQGGDEVHVCFIVDRKIVGLLDRWTVGLLDRSTVGPFDCWIVRALDRSIVRALDCWTVGPMD